MSSGDLLYWGASTLAGLILALAAANYLYNVSQGLPLIPIAALAVAGVVWLTGRSCRDILNDR
jgi:hypothetical protein